jgi:hypothetical protein
MYWWHKIIFMRDQETNRHTNKQTNKQTNIRVMFEVSVVKMWRLLTQLVWSIEFASSVHCYHGLHCTSFEECHLVTRTSMWPKPLPWSLWSFLKAWWVMIILVFSSVTYFCIRALHFVLLFIVTIVTSLLLLNNVHIISLFHVDNPFLCTRKKWFSPISLY